MAKTKELKKRYGAEEGRIITSVLERAVSRERLFLFSAIETVLIERCGRRRRRAAQEALWGVRMPGKNRHVSGSKLSLGAASNCLRLKPGRSSLLRPEAQSASGEVHPPGYIQHPTRTEHDGRREV